MSAWNEANSWVGGFASHGGGILPRDWLNTVEDPRSTGTPLYVLVRHMAKQSFGRV